MPLLIAPENETLTIERVTGDDKVRKHLESLGIVTDGKILIMSHENSGLIVRVNEMRLALDYKIASNIFVAAA